MHASTLRVGHHAFVRVATFAVLVLGVAGCASELAPRLSNPTTKAPYVGVFTGEFVDGKPLYRFPTIEVLGSRRGVTESDGS